MLGLGPGVAGESTLPSEGRDELITFGPPLSDDGLGRLGMAALVRAADAKAARAVPGDTAYAEEEVHEWQFGGRS